MEENREVETNKKQEEKQKKLKDKKNTFTLIYILVGIFAIAVIAMLAYAFIVTR